VGIPKGKYIVETSYDTGPFAGVLKSSKEIKFDGKEVSP